MNEAKRDVIWDQQVCPALGSAEALQVVWPPAGSELVESQIARIARRLFRRIAPNREALNKNPNRESPINLARHLWCSGNGVNSMDICHGAKILQNETVWANAAKIPTEAWYEMCVKPYKLAMVGMRPCAPVAERPADGLHRWRLLALHFWLRRAPRPDGGCPPWPPGGALTARCPRSAGRGPRRRRSGPPACSARASLSLSPAGGPGL